MAIRTVALGARSTHAQLFSALAAGTLLGLAGLAVSATLAPDQLHVARSVLTDAGAAALLGAATLSITRGRYLKRREVTLVGLGLLVLGMMRGLLGDLGSGGLPASVIIALGGLGAIALFAAAVGLGWRAGAVVAGLTATALAISRGLDRPMILTLALAVGWLAVTVLHARVGVSRWLPGVLALTAAAALGRALSDIWLGVWLPIAVIVGAFGAVLAAVGAIHDMGMVLRADQLHARAQPERMHEVRSVLAGLQTAASSLSTYSERLDSSTQQRLHESVSAELDRLSELIDPSTEAAAGTVSLLDAIRPIIVAEVVQGLHVVVDCEDLQVVGRAADIATIVSALLDNARVHADGSSVTLHAITVEAAAGAVVELEVRDNGPGIPADEVDFVFDRGRRGRRSLTIPGSGLGLYLARQRARSMGAELTASVPSEGGAAFVLTLPLAHSTALGELAWLTSKAS